jgi:hypothetical protein
MRFGHPKSVVNIAHIQGFRSETGAAGTEGNLKGSNLSYEFASAILRSDISREIGDRPWPPPAPQSMRTRRLTANRRKSAKHVHLL